ncbi:BspA family leucine-rich repeat surface protein [Leuconostoc falkenbergense]|uniref:BspA family leucine-rich repeat surface protein n=1 Tax=Leuconostoc falkenbergense TaxID=2766470 RepID=UPI0024AE0945|nr:BspA family leucine-rich repeat surface protein [Leuconostoc falkenbergense]MDI6667966.1 BspA family leucine-rich repeat surface protein [Leuconostoc falkenbergense]
MRLKKQLFLTTIILSLPLSGTVQAVTASDINNDDKPVKTSMRLPNEGRSDLQELITRVDSQTNTPSNDVKESDTTQSTDAASSAVKTESQPTQSSSKSTTSVIEKKAQSTNHPQLKATTPITGTYGTSNYTLDLDTGVLTFDGGVLATGKMTTSSEFINYYDQIKEIKFINNVSLPANARVMFAGLSHLEKFDSANLDTTAVTDMSNMFDYTGGMDFELDLAHFNTSAVTNMSNMFYRSQATMLDLSHFNTSQVTNMNAMFYGSEATTLDLSNFNTSQVTDMSYMFAHSEVMALDLHHFNTSHVTDMRNMFDGSEATTLDLSNFNTSHVTDMRNMFNGSRTTTLDLSTFNTSKVTDMSYMFCASITTNIDLSSNFDTSGVTDMAGMFNSTNITTLDLSKFNTSKVKDMTGMFMGSRATSIDLTGSFSTVAVTTMADMFNYSMATTLDLTNFDTSQVTNMRYMFYGARALTLDLSHFTFNSNCDVGYMLSYALFWKLTLGSNQQFNNNAYITDPSKGASIPGTNQYVSGTQWQIVGSGSDHQPAGAKISGSNIPSDTRTEKTTYVWEHVEKWRGVNGNSPWYLNPDTGVLTFYRSEDSSPTALAESVSENLNHASRTEDLLSKVTEIRFEDEVAAPEDSTLLFGYLENLTSFDAANLDTSHVKNMTEMFANDRALTSLNLQSFNTEEVEDMTMMFFMTPSLTMLNLSSFDTSHVKSMSAMFGMTGFKHLDLSHFNTSNVEEMQAMFVASSLETLDISSFDLSALKDLPEDKYGLGTISPVALMFSSMKAIDPESDQGSNLWQVKLGEKTIFPADPGFDAAPASGTAIPGTSYVTNDAAWQIVGNGSVFNPKGNKVTTTEMWHNATRPVTYVWANKNQSGPSIASVDNINFGELNLANTALTPSAINMATGQLKLSDLDGGDYQVTISQADNWDIAGGATISSENLPIKYGDTSLAGGATSFVSGNETIAEKNIKFNHDSSKLFSLDLRGSANLQAVLGKSLTTTLTWTLSDTPE